MKIKPSVPVVVGPLPAEETIGAVEVAVCVLSEFVALTAEGVVVPD